MISIAVAVYPPNAFPLQPDDLISLAAGGNLKTRPKHFEIEDSSLWGIWERQLEILQAPLFIPV